MADPFDGNAWIEEASPGPGRPLITAVERYARQVRVAAKGLAVQITAAERSFCEIWAPRLSGLGFSLPSNSQGVAQRAAQCLVAEWLCGYALNELAAGSTVLESHAWFMGGSPVREPASLPPLRIFPHDAPSAATVRALLPYLLDFARPATRRDVIAGRADGAARRERKTNGVYFTPGDVAQFLVRSLLEEGDAIATVLDPATGTAVFLRQVLASPGSAATFGIDIDPATAEMASFVMTAAGPFGPSPWAAWQLHRAHFATGDSLLCQRNRIPHDHRRRQETYNAVEERLLTGEVCPPTVRSAPLGMDGPWELASVFPQLLHGPDVVVQNPPYASPPANKWHLLEQQFGEPLGNMYSLFTQLGLRLMSDQGRMAAIVPASIVTSGVRSVKKARAALAASGANIEILSYDRAPDGLFGDDVKTRCSIVFVDKAGQPALRLGAMRRLTSHNRRLQLTRGHGVSLPLNELLASQPAKISGSQELRLLSAIRAARTSTLQHLASVTTRPLLTLIDEHCQLALGPTAYNWLNVQLSPDPARKAGHDSLHPYLVLTTRDRATRNAVFAALSSRVALWCWRAFGDGFHVNRSLLGYVPMPDEDDEQALDRLAELGSDLWRAVVDAPVLSKNGGRVSVAFPATCGRRGATILNEIDRLLLDQLELSDASVNLAQWARDLAAVGRQEMRAGAVAWSVVA